MNDINVIEGEGTLTNFIKALAKPLKTLNTEFSTFADEMIYLSKITGQKIYIEKLLNDKFDPIYRRIYILNSRQYEVFYYYNAAEVEPAYYYYNISEGLSVLLANSADLLRLYDFKIVVAAGFVYNASLFNSYVEKFKMPDKTYIIEYSFFTKYSNIAVTEKLYNYNNVLRKTAYTFNRTTGEIYRVEARNENNPTPDEYDFYIDIYNEAGTKIADYQFATGQGFLLNFTWVVPRNSPNFLAESGFAGDFAITLSSATGSLDFGMVVPPQDSILNTIDADGLQDPYHIGVENNTVGAFTLAGLYNYDRDLSAVTSETLLNCFSQVKYDGSSDYTTYIYIVGENGTLLKGVKTEAASGSLGNVTNAIDEIVEVSHGLTTEHLRRVWFINENEGYVFGDNFTLLKTVDAGATWVLIPIVPAPLYNLTCYDGMVVGVGATRKYYFTVKHSITAKYDVLEYTE